MVDYSEVNLLAVVLAAAVNMALGAFWYSPIAFGKPWMEMVGKKPEELGSPAQGYALAGLAAVLSAAALAVVVLAMEARHWVDGLGVGALVGVAFVAPVMAVDTFFHGRSFKLYLLNVAYHVLAFIAMGTILGALQ